MHYDTRVKHNLGGHGVSGSPTCKNALVEEISGVEAICLKWAEPGNERIKDNNCTSDKSGA